MTVAVTTVAMAVTVAVTFHETPHTLIVLDTPRYPHAHHTVLGAHMHAHTHKHTHTHKERLTRVQKVISVRDAMKSMLCIPSRLYLVPGSGRLKMEKCAAGGPR